jgi:cobalt-zinc-cadmium efflux system outer membrane protein
MKIFMAATVASWLFATTVGAQSTTPPTPPENESSQSMQGMDMSQHGSKSDAQRSPSQNSMPGMKMDSAPAQPPAQQEMPGMSMPGMKMEKTPAQPPQQSMPGTKHDMQGMDMSQHEMNGMQNVPTHENLELQEPEDPGKHTGSTTPVPELLGDVSTRTPMSVSDFLSLADANNPTLKQAAAIIRRSDAQEKQAGLYPNPSVGYQGEQIRGGSYGGGEQGAFISQTVVLGGKLGLRRNIYDQQKRSDVIAAEAQTYRVHGDVNKAFYSTLASQEMVLTRRRLLHVALDAVETVHQLANVGQADAPDILQTEVETEQAKVDYEVAQRAFLQNFKMLASLAGKPTLLPAPLNGALDQTPEINTADIVDTIAQDSPSVKLAQQEVGIADARISDAKRELIPDLQLKAGEQYNFEAVSENPRKAAGPQSFATVGINLPVWNRNQGNIRAAEAQREVAQHGVQRTQLSLRQETDPLVQNYLSARFEADRYRTALIPRAQRAYELYLQKYQKMASAYPQVLVSQRTLFQLQISYIDALNSVWQNAIALQNFTLKGGLEAPMSTATPTTTINLPNSPGGSGTE